MNTPSSLYPLKFRPQLKQKVWGGNKLNKNSEEKIGESWEISGVHDNVSEIANGHLKGKSLNCALEKYKQKLVGEKVYKDFGEKFPLLFKFIDANEALSVQVHPDDFLAKQRHNTFGKTEMWYILEAAKDANLIMGFNRKMNRKKYLQALSEKNITSILNSIPVKKGDAFILEPGTVHAIGAGVLLAEIQQTSDITYRIFDYDRPDTNGQLRQLHTDLALDAIDFAPSNARLNYSEEKNVSVHLVTTDYFVVNKLKLSKDFERYLGNIPSFTVYMCLEGNAIIETDGFSEAIKKGETILIPAQFTRLKFKTSSVSFLETYIP